ncbi:MAG: zinc ribbon domain-containing protein [Chloroflexi bacterium]|jgi:putative FmdB family regulatory protein|nr:zinc ribbon domain-containing protein [Chloroflexota bacterium]
MPLYEYRCRNCGARFEVNQAFTDEPISTCHICGGTVKRVVGRGTGVIFKGPGFYVTDTRSANGANGKSASDNGSAESKSAAVTEKAAASGD